MTRPSMFVSRVLQDHLSREELDPEERGKGNNTREGSVPLRKGRGEPFPTGLTTVYSRLSKCLGWGGKL